MTVTFLSSLTRCSDLDRQPFDIAPLPREQWATGDFVVGEVTGPGPNMTVELASGRMVQALRRDRVVGAFGSRAATLEATGSYLDIVDGRMHALTSAGLFGAATSVSTLVAALTKLDYRGHVVRNGDKVRMADFAIRGDGGFKVPTIMLVGTSMSSGKTTAGRMIVHELERAGRKVVGAKLTGAGRFRDMLSFSDAGADAVFDFVDAGLPSTVVAEDEFRAAIRPLLGHIGRLEPDYLVAEAGASPLEPYNGAAAIEELGNHICYRVLCASDPYAVVGVEEAFGFEPDLVTGPAASTSAAVALVRKMTGVDALNMLDPESARILRKHLYDALGL